MVKDQGDADEEEEQGGDGAAAAGVSAMEAGAGVCAGNGFEVGSRKAGFFHIWLLLLVLLLFLFLHLGAGP